MKLSRLTTRSRPLFLAGTILVLAVAGLAPARATAGTTFELQFDGADYISIARGRHHGLVHQHVDSRGVTIPASTGALLDRNGSVIGHFAVVYAGDQESTARVEDLLPGLSLSAVDHVSVENPQIPFVTFRALEAGQFFHMDVGSNNSAGKLEHGSKGVLRDAAGRTGAQFTVVAVGENQSLGRVTEFFPGFFKRDLVGGETRGYFDQVVASSGFANLTPLNVIMLAIGVLFISMGIVKEYEPLLLVPIGFGILIGNIPLPLQIFNAVSVYMIDPVTHEYVFNTTTNSVMGLIYFGVRSGLFPPLIFLGIGALTDFSSLLSNPKSVFLGAAAQIGIFVTFLGALKLGFSPADAAAIGIIGGADGPTAIFLSSRLAPTLIGPIAIAAYSYMAMVPIIQPPIMKILTTKSERLIRMKPGRKVSQRDKIIFPVAGMIVTTLVAPGGLPLLGMLFFGNLLKESGVTGRLSKTASSAVLDTATILLGLAVGASTTAQVFLTRQSMLIFVLGCVAFATATAGGVLFAKLMNLFSSTKINPLIGAAGVSAVPDSARVVHHVGLEADPTNYLLQHAMGPNVAGVIGSAIAAGVFLGFF
jgi:sodium ion-translocating decarboxylase beta subunit